ncbi:MAG TPA: protoporphyrinogen oxidase [Candidatus Acidoferrum sp.]|nr:protoporphyrinogen oxidase [Candidatus Acidoferrum sp.]
MPLSHSVIVVGAGISGLTCAYALKRSGVDVLLLESSSSPGGMIRSAEENGYVFERGPQSFSITAQLNALIDDLELRAELVAAPAKAPRYILVNSRLRPVPLSPVAFLSSSLFEWSTKFSILRDPLGKSFPPEEDESIADFVRRKFKPELLELLVGPFVSGIYAGDPEKISCRAAFPTLYEAEKAAGSLVRGMQAMAKKRTGPRVKPTLASFRQGNQALITALAGKLGDSLRLGTSVSQVTKTSDGQFVIDSVAGQLQCQQLVLATPTSVSSSLLNNLAPAASAALSRIDYAPVAVVSLCYRRADVAHSLDGFGFLVPRSAGFKILGCVWTSSLFPNRTPNDSVQVTGFLGGATDPDTASLSDSSLVDLAHRELLPILGLKAEPITSRVTAYARAIPQYNLGHTQRLATIAEDLAKIPGVRLTGNYLKGPAIGSCVEHAGEVAESLQVR